MTAFGTIRLDTTAPAVTWGATRLISEVLYVPFSLSEPAESLVVTATDSSGDPLTASIVADEVQVSLVGENTATVLIYLTPTDDVGNALQQPFVHAIISSVNLSDSLGTILTVKDHGVGPVVLPNVDRPDPALKTTTTMST